MNFKISVIILGKYFTEEILYFLKEYNLILSSIIIYDTHAITEGDKTFLWSIRKRLKIFVISLRRIMNIEYFK